MVLAVRPRSPEFPVPQNPITKGPAPAEKLARPVPSSWQTRCGVRSAASTDPHQSRQSNLSDLRSHVPRVANVDTICSSRVPRIGRHLAETISLPVGGCTPATLPSVLFVLVAKRIGAENVMCGRPAPDRISLYRPHEHQLT